MSSSFPMLCLDTLFQGLKFCRMLEEKTAKRISRFIIFDRRMSETCCTLSDGCSKLELSFPAEGQKLAPHTASDVSLVFSSANTVDDIKLPHIWADEKFIIAKLSIMLNFIDTRRISNDWLCEHCSAVYITYLVSKWSPCMFNYYIITQLKMNASTLLTALKKHEKEPKEIVDDAIFVLLC